MSEDPFAQVCERVRRSLLHREWYADPEPDRVLCGLSVSDDAVRVKITVPMMDNSNWSDPGVPGLWTLIRHGDDPTADVFEHAAPGWQKAGDQLALRRLYDVLVGFTSDVDAVVRVTVSTSAGGLVASWNVRVQGGGPPALAFHDRTFMPLISIPYQLETVCMLVSGSRPPRLLGLQLQTMSRRRFAQNPFSPATGVFCQDPTWVLPDLRAYVYGYVSVHAAMERARARMLGLHKELMEVAWHPRRIARAPCLLDT